MYLIPILKIIGITRYSHNKLCNIHAKTILRFFSLISKVPSCAALPKLSNCFFSYLFPIFKLLIYKFNLYLTSTLFFSTDTIRAFSTPSKCTILFSFLMFIFSWICPHYSFALQFLYIEERTLCSLCLGILPIALL